MWPASLGCGRWRLRELAIASLLALLVVLQWAYVLRAATSAPLRPPGFVGVDCLASGKGGKAAGSARDCALGQGPDCSLAQPCTPCAASVDARGLDLSSTPCVACSDSNVGDCGFLEGIGPYCDDGTGVVAACTRCCAL
jgi:hypothetical protein